MDLIWWRNIIEFFIYDGMRYLIGYLLSIIGSLILVKSVVREIWNQLLKDPLMDDDVINIRKKYDWHSNVIGCIDVFLYTSSFLAGYPQFIAVWLAFKITGRWGYMVKSKDKLKREYYNIFIIGNAMSIIYGVVGAMTIKWLWEDWFIASIIFIVLVILSILLKWYIKFQYEHVVEKYPKLFQKS